MNFVKIFGFLLNCSKLNVLNNIISEGDLDEPEPSVEETCSKNPFRISLIEKLDKGEKSRKIRNKKIAGEFSNIIDCTSKKLQPRTEKVKISQKITRGRSDTHTYW